MKNNNLIPSLLIACGLFYVGANLNKVQETKVIQAEPVVAKTVASSTGVGEPVIVWYGTVSMESSEDIDEVAPVLISRAWSDGTIEGKYVFRNRRFVRGNNTNCLPFYIDPYCTEDPFITMDWFVISSPQMACRTDINGNGEIEFGDLLAVLNDWGTETTCPDVVQLQCGLMEMN